MSIECQIFGRKEKSVAIFQNVKIEEKKIGMVLYAMDGVFLL
jgi:hypothetical protein